VRTYLDGFDLLQKALDHYDGDVKHGRFPSAEESYQ
jgi:ketopantoate hydroxymethyltransferase